MDAPAFAHDAAVQMIDSLVSLPKANARLGAYRDVQTYLRERIKEVLTCAGEAIVVRIFGSR